METTQRIHEAMSMSRGCGAGRLWARFYAQTSGLDLRRLSARDNHMVFYVAYVLLYTMKDTSENEARLKFEYIVPRNYSHQCAVCSP